MLLEIKIPSPGESISEVELATWLVEDGDYVEKDQSIAEIDSDKATLELPAEESGKIKILVEEGQVVAVGEVVCTIDVSVKSNKKSQQPNDKEKKDLAGFKKEKLKNKTTPLASAIIKKNDISIDQIQATAKSGKITKTDVLGLLNDSKTNSLRTQSSSPMSSLRRKIAKRLVAVKNETAMLTTFNEVDMSEIFNVRNDYKADFFDKHGVKLGFMSFFTKAVTNALLEYKDVNAMINGNEIIHYNYADIGIAVSAPKGLMVPILRNAEKMSFLQIESQINRLATKAREGKITIEEMLGGTFTITNGGVFGSMLSTPIINPPQSAILGMHNIVERAVVVEGNVKVRPIMYIALSYDHRIIDGRESVGFLCRVKEQLENPISMLLNNNIKKSLEI